MEVKYSYEWYSDFLGRLNDKGFSFVNFGEDPQAGEAFLRHDVDWSPKEALRVAQIEDELEIRSSFFFLLNSPFYNVFEEENKK